MMGGGGGGKEPGARKEVPPPPYFPSQPQIKYFFVSGTQVKPSCKIPVEHERCFWMGHFTLHLEGREFYSINCRHPWID